MAEEHFLRQVTSGASSDIERATEVARVMVYELGISPVGPVRVRPAAGAWDRDARAAGFGEETARRVDEEIRALVMRGCETARQIVRAAAAGHQVLAEELLDVESVDVARVKQTLEERLADSPSPGHT